MIASLRPMGGQVQAPLLHMNGSGFERLFTGYTVATHALYHSVKALAEIEHNARDYYPLDPDAWNRAQKEHRARFDSLNKVLAELSAILENINEQNDARNAR